MTQMCCCHKISSLDKNKIFFQKGNQSIVIGRAGQHFASSSNRFIMSCYTSLPLVNGNQSRFYSVEEMQVVFLPNIGLVYLFSDNTFFLWNFFLDRLYLKVLLKNSQFVTQDKYLPFSLIFLSKYIELYALRRPRSNLNTILPLNSLFNF